MSALRAGAFAVMLIGAASAQSPSATGDLGPTEDEARALCEREAVAQDYAGRVERCIRSKTFRRRLESMKQQSEANTKAYEDSRAAMWREYDEKRAAEAREAAEWAKRPAGVRIGMTAAQVRKTQWGKPDSVNVTHTRYGTHEQWVYGLGKYLYFENGVLTSIQTSR